MTRLLPSTQDRLEVAVVHLEVARRRAQVRGTWWALVRYAAAARTVARLQRRRRMEVLRARR